MKKLAFGLGLIMAIMIAAVPAFSGSESARLAHTYSIVAIDKATGELGAAVQSHWFSPHLFYRCH